MNGNKTVIMAKWASEQSSTKKAKLIKRSFDKILDRSLNIKFTGSRHDSIMICVKEALNNKFYEIFNEEYRKEK